MHTDDHQIAPILKKCRQNKRAAQKELYKLFYSYGMSICLRYSGNRQDAVEILNDGFMKVFQHIRQFKADKPFRPWLRRILINAAIDHCKRSRRKVELIQMEEVKEAAGIEIIESNLSYEELIGMVQRLPQVYRTVFNLIAIEGYTHAEVADLLGISVGTSKSNYHRARQKLQQYLNEYLIK